MHRRVPGMGTGRQTHQPRINAVFLQNTGDKCLALLSPGVNNPGLLSQAGQYLDLGPPGRICRDPAGQAHAGGNDKLSREEPHSIENCPPQSCLQEIVCWLRGRETWKNRIAR